MNAARIRVEVVYADARRQVREVVELPAAATIRQAIGASQLPARFPQIRLGETPVGVFGARRPWDWRLADDDRVEIYRPLLMSPTDARRRRAAAKRSD